MLFLTTTTQTLEVLLSAAPAATQAPFTAHYADITTSAFTPGAQNGVTNSTTAVTILSAPAASTQRQLKAFSLYNADTSAMQVTIRLNDNSTLRNLAIRILRPGESLHYVAGKWVVTDTTGARKMAPLALGPSTSLIRPPGLHLQNSTTVKIPVTNSCYAEYLGKAERSWTSFTAVYRITTLGATFTWAEFAIATGPAVISAGANLTNRGFVDVTGVVNTTGLKSSTITTTGIRPGDDIWLLFGVQATTVCRYRGSLTDDLAAGFQQSVATTRPSTMAAATAFAVESTAQDGAIWCVVQAS